MKRSCGLLPGRGRLHWAATAAGLLIAFAGCVLPRTKQAALVLPPAPGAESLPVPGASLTQQTGAVNASDLLRLKAELQVAMRAQFAAAGFQLGDDGQVTGLRIGGDGDSVTSWILAVGATVGPFTWLLYPLLWRPLARPWRQVRSLEQLHRLRTSGPPQQQKSR